VLINDWNDKGMEFLYSNRSFGCAQDDKGQVLDCRVASLLAMTGGTRFRLPRPSASQ
jgi:hypothetical protein